MPPQSAGSRPPDAPAKRQPSGRRILITGGAGFVGASLAIGLAERHRDCELVALDSLHRRGAELNLPRLRRAGVSFVHGDVRSLEDLLAVGEVDALIECSAEPSVLAGVDGSPDFVVKTNLLGAYHCLELARRCGAQFVLLSTSRVYPVAALEALDYAEDETRLRLLAKQRLAGASECGISERFPLDGARTLYGATKLAGELLVTEYAASYGVQAAIDRCGVIAGPWQMGKVDQGVFTYWMLAHHFGRPLQYIGFGGSGKQVRDLLHIDDLLDLLDEQLADPQRWAGTLFNVGGGADCSLSLLETTELCREITGATIVVERSAEVRPGDVPIYISDCSSLRQFCGWSPQRGAVDILRDIHDWIVEHEAALAAAL